MPAHVYTRGQHHSQPFKRKKKTISHWALSSQTLLGWLASAPTHLCFLHKHWHCHYTLLSPAVPVLGIRSSPHAWAAGTALADPTPRPLSLVFWKPSIQTPRQLCSSVPQHSSLTAFLISLVINGHPSWGEMEAHCHFDSYLTAQFAKYPNLSINFFHIKIILHEKILLASACHIWGIH